MLKNQYPALGILLGSALLSISLGPFSNWDSQTEFSAASGVLRWGLPYITYGKLINMQPFGFYIGAFFLRIFGTSYGTATNVATLFSIGSVFLLWNVGKELYGARVGLIAAALFALTPWQVIMSRVFLIDVQCLFFSLLFLLLGIWAIRKNSLRLFLVAGILFGVALLTKLFAVFMLIPLSLIYVYLRYKNHRRFILEITIFFLSAFLIQCLWYYPVSGRGLISVFNQDDFNLHLPNGFVPSPFYSFNFLNQSLGDFFLLGFGFSILFSFLQRKSLSKILVYDLIFLTTIVGILGLSTYLAVGKSLLVPYVDSIKYDYLSLPFFCLIAASLAKKCSVLSRLKKTSTKHWLLILCVAGIGLYFLVVSMIFNLVTLNILSKYDWLTFNVEGGLGYSFDRLTPVLASGYLVGAQFAGFIIIQLSLLWANRDKLESIFVAL
jgi:4-amino-4-deoxy-L-arabinose transferase-like glycosyltransferase